MKKIGIFIAGRLESQRLPNKLILPLRKTNLWEMACIRLAHLKDKYNVYALCNDKQLIKIAKKYKLNIIERAPETCLVDGPFNFIYKDVLNVEDDYLMFLNPCLYNLGVETIEKALKYFNKSPYESMTSVKEYNNWLYQQMGEKYWLKTIVNKENWSTKEIKGYYEAAHCFHIFNKDLLKSKNEMLGIHHDCFVVPKKETLDVDTPEDFEYAKYFLEGKNDN